MIEVLEPLEVRAGDTTSVDEHIWGTDNSLSLEDLLSLEGGWTISSFKNSFDLDLVSIASVKRFLNSSWDHAVSLLQKVSVWIRASVFDGLWIAGKRSVFGQMLLHILDIETIRVVDGRVVLDDGGDLSSIFLNEFRGPVTHSSESLNNKGLVLDSEVEINLFDE